VKTVIKTQRKEMLHDKKNKVGIISINFRQRNLNYGATLHSFAFQKYLDKYNVDNVIIDYLPQFLYKKYRMDFPILNAFLPRLRLKTVLGRLLVGFFLLIPAKIRYNKFYVFFKRNYRKVDNCGEPFDKEVFFKHTQISSFDFEKIVCESDIIWSPKFNEGFDRAFFCDYDFSKQMIKVAYAASISDTNFTKDEEQIFKTLLDNFDYISVREFQTRDYVQTLTGKSIYHVLDPVLLLNAEDFLPYCKNTKARNYVLVYNCGKNDRIMLKRAKKFAQSRGLKLIEISFYPWNVIYNKVVASAGIEEFLGYFLNAEFVITNAFHGICFSILFKKDFYVFERDGIDLKGRSLVAILGLEDRFIAGKNNQLTNKRINYDDIYKILDSERKKSAIFIKDAIIDSKGL
jgi:hypothetical protein